MTVGNFFSSGGRPRAFYAAAGLRRKPALAREALRKDKIAKGAGKRLCGVTFWLVAEAAPA
jgi:hypothetical protein